MLYLHSSGSAKHYLKVHQKYLGRYGFSVANIAVISLTTSFYVVVLKLNHDKKPLIIKQPEVGQLIRELRLKTGLTQEKFAAKLGVTYPTVNRWERGRAKPSPMAIGRIEDMLQDMGNLGQDLLAKYLK